MRPQSMERASMRSRVCCESLVVDRTRLEVAGGRSVGIASLETLYISCGGRRCAASSATRFSQRFFVGLWTAFRGSISKSCISSDCRSKYYSSTLAVVGRPYTIDQGPRGVVLLLGLWLVLGVWQGRWFLKAVLGDPRKPPAVCPKEP